MPTVNSGSPPPPVSESSPAMQTQIKNALLTTAIVLATIYVLRKVPMVNGFVSQALNG